MTRTQILSPGMSSWPDRPPTNSERTLVVLPFRHGKNETAAAADVANWILLSWFPTYERPAWYLRAKPRKDIDLVHEPDGEKGPITADRP